MYKNKTVMKNSISVLSVLLGIVILLTKESMISRIIVGLGILLLIYGTYQILRFVTKKTNSKQLIYSFPTGFFALVLGLVMTFSPTFILTFINILLSIFFILFGVSKITILKSIKKLSIKTTWIPYAIGMIWIILGIGILMTPYFATLTIDFIISFSLIIYGVSNLISVPKNKNVKQRRKIVIDVED